MASSGIHPRGTWDVAVGGLSRGDLIAELATRGISLNGHAQTLLDDAAFDGTADREVVSIAERSLIDLGFPEGASLSRVYARAGESGLRLCPAIAGPYLRLAMTDQASAPDPVLSSGRAPSGSLTVAAPVLRADDDFPKGFYLRVIAGRPWLRGYQCDDEHIWAPEDRFAFRVVS